MDRVQDPARARFPLLDPLRALAAIGVMLVHTAVSSQAYDDPVYGRFLAHLDIGVPIFFVLSAFVLYRPFVEARVTRSARTRFSDYGRRRFARIVPAYWAVLTITAIVPGMAGAFTGNWWVYYGLLQSFPVYTVSGACAVDPYHCAVPVAWTLTVEVLFYLTLPLFVLSMGALVRRAGRHWLWLDLSAITLLTAISIMIQRSIPLSDLHIWLFFSPLGRGWWFGVGLAFAAVSVHVAHRAGEPGVVRWLRRHPGPPVALGIMLYALMATTVLRPTPSLAFPAFIELGDYVAEYLLFGVIAALVVLPAVFGADGDGFTRRVLRHRALAWLGLISYGIYLWHFPVVVLFSDAGVKGFVPLTVLTFALTVVCATASYYLLERPLMRWAHRLPAVAGIRRTASRP